MTRLSVMMRPRYREALELIARDRGTSLSQALEYLIAVGARSYRIDGKTVMDLVIPVSPGEEPRAEWPDVPDALKEMTFLEFQTLQSASEIDPREVEQRAAKSPAMKILRMPESLRRPEESYFVEAYDSLGEGVKRAFAVDIGALDAFQQACLAAFQAGFSLDELKKVLLSKAKASKS
ncbi:hypothetical protein [Achromobacter animicus]|uniref:hypothetical protein n=1 Tax=Achromobacter animicus TaxID=1389935 RepID=UPI001581F2CF|nr:hypothetical protein [Achromobacter animicus]